MNHYQWIWRYAQAYKSKSLLALLFIFLNALLIIINPLLAGELIDWLARAFEDSQQRVFASASQA